MSNNFGVTDTKINGITDKTLTIPTLNWGVDFAVVSNNKAGTAVITNTTTGIDQDERFRFVIDDVADIYKGTSVPIEYREPVKQGTLLLCQLTEVSKVTDSAGKLHYLPQSLQITYKCSKSAYLPESDFETMLCRAIAGYYDHASVRVKAMLKAAIMPKGL